MKPLPNGFLISSIEERPPKEATWRKKLNPISFRIVCETLIVYFLRLVRHKARLVALSILLLGGLLSQKKQTPAREKEFFFFLAHSTFASPNLDRSLAQ
jgi:hypothetical protein